MKQKTTIISLLALMGSLTMQAQGYIEATYLSASSLKDKAGNIAGKGDMTRITGRYTFPLSVQRDARGRVTAWTGTFSGSYAYLGNRDGAGTLNPEQMLNTSFNISHTRPLGENWKLIASLGAGIYAHPDEIRLRSVLANGAAIFAYRLGERLHVGMGVALTNSYGAPMVLPVGYLVWQTGGTFRMSVDMASGLKVKASANLSPRFGLELTAIEMDGMSAVTEVEGKSRIYSATLMRSHLSASYRIAPRTSVYLSAGGNWMRSIRLSERSLRSFFKSFSNNEGKYRFDPAWQTGIGLRYGF